MASGRRPAGDVCTTCEATCDRCRQGGWLHQPFGLAQGQKGSCKCQCPRRVFYNPPPSPRPVPPEPAPPPTHVARAQPAPPPPFQNAFFCIWFEISKYYLGDGHQPPHTPDGGRYAHDLADGVPLCGLRRSSLSGRGLIADWLLRMMTMPQRSGG